MKPTMKELLKEWRQNIKENVSDENLNEADIGMGATTFEGWVGNDDSVFQIGTPGTDGVYEWACDPSGGTAEMEYIIARIRELYSLGGAIEKIEVLDMR